MNVGSLFSGVGGMDLGLEQAGHTVRFQAEIDPFRRAVLHKHWPDALLFDDVRKVTHDSAGSVELLCGGFPCQDLSVAGNRAGLAGDRSGLFFEFARVADECVGHGGWILVENVRGLFSSNGGRDFGVVLDTLADLGFHDLAWRLLDSRYFGVPQRRQRVFILARRAAGRRASTVLLEPESGGGNHQAVREEKAKAAGHVGPSVEVTGATQSLSTRFGNTGADFPDAEAGWIIPDGQPDLAATLTKGSATGAGVSVPGRRQEDDVNLTAVGFHATQDPISTDGSTPCLPAKGNLGVVYDAYPDPAGTVSRRIGKGVNTTFDDGAVVVCGEPESGSGGDSLRPSADEGRREAGAGLRGGPSGADGEEADPYGMRAAAGFSGRLDGPSAPSDPRPDGRRYAACGDAVSVPVARWIGERLNKWGTP